MENDAAFSSNASNDFPYNWSVRVMRDEEEGGWLVERRLALECQQPVRSGALFDFVTCGILINLVGLFGIFGNAISMIILSRPQMKSSINYLLIGLARCDTVLIIIAVLIYGLPAIYAYTGLLFDYKFIVYPRIVRYLYPLSCAAQIVTVYLTLTVTIERYIAVCHPLKARSFCTYGRARLAVLAILIFAILYNLPKFWEIDFDTEVHWKYNVTIYCVYPAELRSNDLYVTVYVHWMYFFICYTFPFVALVVFNVAIYRRDFTPTSKNDARRLIEMKKVTSLYVLAAALITVMSIVLGKVTATADPHVRKANRDLQHLSRHQRREISLATMLLCVVVVFIICNILPLASNIHETFISDPPLWLVQTGNLLVTINSSINFIIYVIFGRKFKRIFLRLFCSSRFLAPDRESPEFQTYDESLVTNTTNVELRNSIRHCHLHRSNTLLVNRNNNIQPESSLPIPPPPSRASKASKASRASRSPRSPSPGPCVYYPARSPLKSPTRQNGWKKNGSSADSVL